jgi:hypothetical protein
LIETNLPRHLAGEISAMYIGDRLEASPMPTPPRMRKRVCQEKVQAIAVPMAEAENRGPEQISSLLRPSRSLRTPDRIAPSRQPNHYDKS